MRKFVRNRERTLAELKAIYFGAERRIIVARDYETRRKAVKEWLALREEFRARGYSEIELSQVPTAEITGELRRLGEIYFRSLHQRVDLDA